MLLAPTAMLAARAVRAQQMAMPVIGFLHFASPGPFALYVGTFRKGLSETGYVEGENPGIEFCWAEGRYVGGETHLLRRAHARAGAPADPRSAAARCGGPTERGGRYGESSIVRGGSRKLDAARAPRNAFLCQAKTRSETISFPLVSGPRYSAKHQLPPPIRQPINIGIENPRS